MRVSGRVVTPDGLLEPGWVEVDGDRISGVGAGGGGGPLILPGFVDIHVHGGGGHTFTTGDPDEARAAAAFHARHGTTTLLASLVSMAYESTLAATKAYAPLVDEGVLAGVHCEGPYLSLRRCGAQNPDYLRDPSIVELDGLVQAAPGTVRVVTLAPELTGAIDVIRWLRSVGIVVAVGHTDATYQQTLEAIEAGATIATHLFNGMRPIHHREPGPIIALLGDDRVTCELVADGRHMHSAMLAYAMRAGRSALITDAIQAAGMPDGVYALGGQRVIVVDRVARLAGRDAIAGSTLTMDAALRNATQAGASIVDASRMASGTPAEAIGLASSVGSIAAGLRADLIELTDDLMVSRVMRGGRWLS